MIEKCASSLRTRRSRRYSLNPSLARRRSIVAAMALFDSITSPWTNWTNRVTAGAFSGARNVPETSIAPPVPMCRYPFGVMALEMLGRSGLMHGDRMGRTCIGFDSWVLLGNTALGDDNEKCVMTAEAVRRCVR
jgi:hypothetical protein